MVIPNCFPKRLYHYTFPSGVRHAFVFLPELLRSSEMKWSGVDERYPRGRGRGGVGGKGGSGGRGEKWPKPCMHIWIIKQKNFKKKRYPCLHSHSKSLIFNFSHIQIIWFLSSHPLSSTIGNVQNFFSEMVMAVGLISGPSILFCSIPFHWLSLFLCRIMLFLLLWLCSIVWSQVLWYLKHCSLCSGLLWLFWVCCVSVWTLGFLKYFCIFLWRMTLESWLVWIDFVDHFW
jgi:hypothetical protein